MAGLFAEDNRKVKAAARAPGAAAAIVMSKVITHKQQLSREQISIQREAVSGA